MEDDSKRASGPLRIFAVLALGIWGYAFFLFASESSATEKIMESVESSWPVLKDWAQFLGSPLGLASVALVGLGGLLLVLYRLGLSDPLEFVR